MTVSLDLPEAVQARLEAEAARRGITLGQLVAQLADQLPAGVAEPERGATRHRLSFVGIGASGRTEPLDIHRERSELAAKKLADGV
jgi:hypothetical protein